jgi:GNAT superfamily N-acetyltransferase
VIATPFGIQFAIARLMSPLALNSNFDDHLIPMEEKHILQATKLYRSLLSSEIHEEPTFVELDGNNKVIAALWVDYFTHPRLGVLVELSLVVSEKYQGCGIGKKLFQRAKEHFPGATIALRAYTPDGTRFCKALNLKLKDGYYLAKV